MQPAAASDSDYYTRLGLSFDPFAADALPDFFFVGAQRRFLVQRAVHALYFSGVTVVLLGADGAGKTRTLLEVEKETKDLVDICHIEATVLMDAGEIRVLLASALGLPGIAAAGNVELVHALERLRPANGDPQPVLIAIDAAHLLSIDTLAECAGLVSGAGGRLRLLLVGEPDLLLAWQQVQAGVAEILELKALDRHEAEDYVRTKLQAAGFRDEKPLSDSQCEQLFARSGGNFAAINALVPQLLQPTQEAVAVSRRLKVLPLLSIAGVAILIAVIILFVLYRDGNSPSAPTSASTANNSSQQTKHGVEQSTVALPLPAPMPAASTVPDAIAIATAPVAATQPPMTTIAPVEEKNATKEIPAVVEKKAIPAKKDNTEITAAAARVEKREREKTQTEKPQAEKVSEPAKVVASDFTTDERALLAMPSSQYVLQLIGAESKATIDKFANNAGKGVKLYCYRTQLRGKPWFIAVTGPYVDKNSTQAALTKLPDAVRKQQPWARTLANVQGDIRAHSTR